MCKQIILATSWRLYLQQGKQAVEDSLAVVDTVAAGVDNLAVEGTGVDSLNQHNY